MGPEDMADLDSSAPPSPPEHCQPAYRLPGHHAPQLIRHAWAAVRDDQVLRRQYTNILSYS